jgi:hypothetical protein
MRKLSVGLLAAIVIALATAPADAAKKKKSGGKAKGKAEVSKTVEHNPLGDFGCFLSNMAGTKPSGPACGG